MNKLNFQKTSNILINIGLVLSIISIFLVVKSRINLPPGVCPVENYSLLLYLSIGTSLLGLLLSFIKTKVN